MAGRLPQRRPPADSDSLEEPRARLIAAISKTAAEQGYRKVTVEQVTRSAGLPGEAFDEQFESWEQGLIAAYEVFLERLRREVVAACASAEPWPTRVRAALGALLTSMVEASALARAFIVEATATSLAATERLLSAIEAFAVLLREGRSVYPDAASLPDTTERALVGGVASIVSGHLLAEDPRALEALKPQLVELLLLPYVGAGEARRVAAG